MAQATTPRGFVSTLLPFKRVRHRTNDVARQVELPRIPAGKKDLSWLEDAFNLVLLCVLAGAGLGASAVIARAFFHQLMQLNNFDLMRAIAGM